MSAAMQMRAHRAVASDVGRGLLAGVLSAVVAGLVTLTLTPVPGIVACAACLWGVGRLAKRWPPRRWYHLWLPVGLGFALVQAGAGALLAMIGGEGWMAAMAYLMVGVITVPVAGVLLIKGLAAAVSDWRRGPGVRTAGDWMIFGAGALGLGLLGLSAWFFFA